MEYKIGDRVRIVSSRAGQDRWNYEGLMDEYMGTVMTVDGTRRTSNGDTTYRMREDNGHWYWYPWMIRCKEEEEVTNMFSKSDLVNGDILVMRNEERYVVMKDYGGIGLDTWLGINIRGWCKPENFDSDLKHPTYGGGSSMYDVMKVLRPMTRRANIIGNHDKDGYKVVYDRNTERKRMTVEDIERELGYKVAIVDQDGVDRG